MKQIYFYIILLILILYSNLHSKTWYVSPDGDYKFCSQVSNLVNDNDTIYIESGRYENDPQVTWRKNNLCIFGLNGKPELVAGDKISNDQSNGKGIFVVQGNNTIIENIIFKNSSVPDYNGAGIRQEGRNLIVRNCEFIENEMGILQGGTISNCSIIIEYCKFEINGSKKNPGYQHNIYINHIDSLIFRFNSSINATASGHELKSRANYNFLEYNRISNISTVDSRNIDIPNGGTTIILGNIIEQGENSENSNIIGFGMEGATNTVPHNLYIVNNTIVNYKTKGNFLSVKDTDSLFFKNNICVGAKTGGLIIGNYNSIDSSNNLINDKIEFAKFKIKSIIDYELENDSPAKNTGLNINKIINGHSLYPEYEYLIDFGILKRIIEYTIDIGAREFTTKDPEIIKPDKVVLVEPQDSAVFYTDTIRFIWRSSAPFVKNYHLEIFNDNKVFFGKADLTDTSFVFIFDSLIGDFSDNYYWKVRASNSSGWGEWSTQFKFKTDLKVSISELELSNNIYPNPVSEYIEINLDRCATLSKFGTSGGNEIKIYNTFGECVMTEQIHPITSSHRMNIEHLPIGLYFIQIGDKFAKFVKE